MGNERKRGRQKKNTKKNNTTEAGQSGEEWKRQDTTKIKKEKPEAKEYVWEKEQLSVKEDKNEKFYKGNVETMKGYKNIKILLSI